MSVSGFIGIAVGCVLAVVANFTGYWAYDRAHNGDSPQLVVLYGMSLCLLGIVLGAVFS